jgi:hypothetical protein
LRFKGALFAVCSLCLSSAAVYAKIEITEVMADPPGSGFRNEYVELMNLGDRPIHLDWDQDEANNAVYWSLSYGVAPHTMF